MSYTYRADEKELEDFDENDLAHYNYIGLYDFREFQDHLDEAESALIRSSLAKAMRDECLFVSAASLEALQRGWFIKSIYNVFKSPPRKKAYVGVATVFPGIADGVLLRPSYRTIETKGRGRHRYFAAVNAAVEGLFSSTRGAAFRTLECRWRSPNQNTHVIPNGSRIREARRKLGSQEYVVSKSRIALDGSEVTIAETSLKKAERFIVMDRSTVEKIAKFLHLRPSEAILDEVVPDTEKFAKLRLESTFSKIQLASELGIGSPRYLDLLEDGGPIPADSLRFLCQEYEEVLGRKLKIRDLLNIEKSTAIVSD